MANWNRRVICLLVFLLPVLSMFSGLVTVAWLLVTLLAAALPVWRSLYTEIRSRTFWQSTPIKIIALLLVWPALTAAFSIIPQFSAMLAVKTALLMLAGVMFARALQLQPELAPPAIRALSCGLILATALIPLEFVPGGGLLTKAAAYAHVSPEVFMSREINRGICLLAVMVWPAVYGLQQLGQKRFAWLLPLLVAPAIFLMHSASAKMGWILGGAILIGVTLERRYLPRVIAGGILLFLLAWPLLFHTYEAPLRGDKQLYDKLPPSSQHRVVIWHFVLDKFTERPVIGWGMDSSRAIPGGKEEFDPGRQYLPLHPHNNILQILLEQGVIGLALSLTALALVMRGWLKMPEAAVGSIIVSYLAVSMTAFGMWQHWWIAVAWIAWAFYRWFSPQAARTGTGV